MIQKIASTEIATANFVVTDHLVCDENRSCLPFGFHSGSVNEKQSDLPSTQFKIEKIDNVERLNSIRPQWERLIEMAVEPNTFYHPEFLIPSFQEFAQSKTSVLAIWATPRVNPEAENILCGLLPIQPRTSVAGVPCNIIEVWKHDHVYLTTPLLRRDVLTETWCALVKWINENTSAKLIHFPLLAADSVFHRMLVDWLTDSESHFFVKQRYLRALFLQSVDADAFTQRGLSRKKRHASRRCLKLMSQLGEVDFSQPTTPVEIEKWRDDFLMLEQSSWKGENKSALACDPSNKRFWNSLVQNASELGRLMPLGMRLNGKLVAGKCNLRTGNGGFAFKIAYDPAYAKYSPGTLLEIENINRMHEQNIGWMDSCASAHHPMIDSLWPDRRVIESVYISTERRFSKLISSILPLLAWIKRLSN